jgi:hypothetical protein
MLPQTKSDRGRRIMIATAWAGIVLASLLADYLIVRAVIATVQLICNL